MPVLEVVSELDVVPVFEVVSELDVVPVFEVVVALPPSPPPPLPSVITLPQPAR